MVSTHLKNISQIGNLPQIEVKIKNIWNHHRGCEFSVLIIPHVIPAKKTPIAAVESLLALTVNYVNCNTSQQLGVSSRYPWNIEASMAPTCWGISWKNQGNLSQKPFCLDEHSAVGLLKDFDIYIINIYIYTSMCHIICINICHHFCTGCLLSNGEYTGESWKTNAQNHAKYYALPPIFGHKIPLETWDFQTCQNTGVIILPTQTMHFEG